MAAGVASKPIGHRPIRESIRLFVLRPRDMLNAKTVKTLYQLADENMEPLKLRILHSIISTDLPGKKFTVCKDADLHATHF